MRIKPTSGGKACGFTASRGLSAAPLGKQPMQFVARQSTMQCRARAVWQEAATPALLRRFERALTWQAAQPNEASAAACLSGGPVCGPSVLRRPANHLLSGAECSAASAGRALGGVRLAAARSRSSAVCHRLRGKEPPSGSKVNSRLTRRSSRHAAACRLARATGFGHHRPHGQAVPPQPAA